MATENGPFEDDFPMENGDIAFNRYVSLPAVNLQGHLLGFCDSAV